MNLNQNHRHHYQHQLIHQHNVHVNYFVNGLNVLNKALWSDLYCIYKFQHILLFYFYIIQLFDLIEHVYVYIYTKQIRSHFVLFYSILFTNIHLCLSYEENFLHLFLLLLSSSPASNKFFRGCACFKYSQR